MSEDRTIEDQMAAYAAKAEVAAKLAQEVLPDNKRVLFDALAAAGIALVIVGFDGYGDSGQIDALRGFDVHDDEAPLPTTHITVRSADFETGTVIEQNTSVAEFVETLVWDFLRQTHYGWEDNDGGFGEFKLSVGDAQITLEYEERYTATTSYEHRF